MLLDNVKRLFRQFYSLDLELYLQTGHESGLSLDDVILILLLFADKMVILGKSPFELQNHLDLLHSKYRILTIIFEVLIRS
jgi:hypothetical protein